ncbi:MAG: hypothetical protein Q8R36_02910 [bacterium]|nr:hypothetical protein [bacterium]
MSCLSTLLFCLVFVSCAYTRNDNEGKSDSVPLAVGTETGIPVTILQSQEEKEVSEEPEIPPVGLYAAVPYCEAKITVTTGVLSDEVTEWKEFVVQVCELPFDFSRVPFGIIIQSQRLAHGALWTNLKENNNWHVLEYRIPETKKDFAKLDAEGEMGFRRSLYVLEAGLPVLIQKLPRDIQEEILGFMAYPHGGFEILLLKNNEAMAQRVLRAVNIVLKKR